ncbi:MAG: preprotein translocase subunit SecG [Gemmatimonadota bacterium]|nr:preprotein translocase subunit SecG [Gemmatimonadota bacterium]
MYSILLILLVLDCFALMLVVLLQSGKGGGLAAGFGGAGTGMESMGSRQTATFLHTSTQWLGGAFLVIAFVLSLMAVRDTGPRSLIETEMQRQQQQAPTGGAPAGTPTDLQDILEEGGEGPAPADEAAPGGEPGADETTP